MLAAIAALATATSFGQMSVRGRKTLDFAIAGSPPMQIPTGVAVAPDGRVLVADGVNDRVLEFDPDGSCIRKITTAAGKALSRPLSVKVAPGNEIWIADTGNLRIVVLGSDGAEDRVFMLDDAPPGHPADFTDLAISADASHAWVVDDANHRLARVEAATGRWTFAGRAGESLGQFNHPFMIVADSDGDLFVSDVINGRVQALTSGGAPLRSLGSYGVRLGQLYRPKGVACDSDGNVWVSDSVLGVVQVFAPDGGFVDVLRSVDGEPLRLESPLGLAFDAVGCLYVVESKPGRVRKFEIERSKTPQRPAVRPQIAAGQARACTVCHLEWIEPLDRQQATELTEPPAGSPDDPYVSRSETCLSCHDGSVVDSRRRVWLEHGHRTGVQIPGAMTVPANLPLIDGKIACRTCHSGHGGGAPQGDLRTAVFLRVPNTASELCISCHNDKTRGPQFGTHPTGGMPWAVPQKLIDAGARIGPNPRELTCQVCHTPHGAAHDHLLVMATESNQLCLSCHDQMRPGMFRDGAAEHPLAPKVNAEQVAAVARLGTKLGDDGTLICLSCHKLHHGKGERYMLADDLVDGRMCLQCHSDRREMLGSPHDLRKNFPDEKNRLGMTPESGGPCSSCHLFHRYARAPEASPVDPGGGKCVTCHQKGRVAAARVLGSVNHPGTRCTDCHNPHNPRFGMFLKSRPTDICASCHADKTSIAQGPHDLMADLPRSGEIVDRPAEEWPKASRDADDTCLACHRPHGAERAGLFRVEPAADAEPADAVCIACHPGSNWGSQGDLSMVHPRESQSREPSVGPETSSEGGRIRESSLGATPPPDRTTENEAGQIGCRTCHDPHKGPSAAGHLLRVADGAPSESVCLQCHTGMSGIDATGHAASSLKQAQVETGACKPCHSVHANPLDLEPRLLWPRSLAAVGLANVMPRDGGQLSPVESFELSPVQDVLCSGCHRTGGPAPLPRIATHPRGASFNAFSPASPGYLPLFDANGSPHETGIIQCRTCHLPHGRHASIVREANLAPPVTAAEQRAQHLLLRPFVPPNACTSCHGADGLRRFLYFHDQDRRGGPVRAEAWSSSAP